MKSSFLVWLLSLIIITSRFIQDVVCINSSFCLIPSSIPRCKYTEVCLPFYLLIDIWVISGLWLFKIKLHLWLLQMKLFFLSPMVRGERG